MSDCVITLDQRIRNEVSTRWLRVVKYRGSAHQTNEYPFLITARGFSVPPVTTLTLDYGAPRERISTGVPQLDHMLSGGPFRGSAVLVSGSPGTGKTTLGAHLIDAACTRGERALLVLFEESPNEMFRNMGSVGLDLERWVEAGLLRVCAVRSAEFGLDNHLALVSGLVAEHAPAVAVIDGIDTLLVGHSRGEVSLMLARKFHLFKDRGITAMATVLAEQDGETAMGVSSRADTWLLLRNVESNGKRNRLLFVLKSRGTAHSDEVREFALTDHGIELFDVYVGPGGVMTGSARLAQTDWERRDQLAAEEDELKQIAGHEERLAAEAQASRRATGAQRWADPGAASRRSVLAIENLQLACEQHLAGQHHIEIVDLLENPRLAVADQILAVPTLVKELPLPIRKIVGDLSDTDRLLDGLQLRRPGAGHITRGHQTNV